MDPTDCVDELNEDKEKALEISWAVDIAANYTTISRAFCASKD